MDDFDTWIGEQATAIEASLRMGELDASRFAVFVAYKPGNRIEERMLVLARIGTDVDVDGLTLEQLNIGQPLETVPFSHLKRTLKNACAALLWGQPIPPAANLEPLESAAKPYDANDDLEKSLLEGYRAVRDRKAAGGPGLKE